MTFFLFTCLFTRKEIRVSKVILHEGAYDIALLKLGRKNLFGDSLNNLKFKIQFTEERVDLSVFSPVCLPGKGESFLGEDGFVFGEQQSI